MTRSDEESLEPVLRAAFGPEDNHPPLNQDVFDRIATATGSGSRVALRDPPGEHGPVALPLSPQSAAAAKKIGRYELSGEIAQGGMGIVLKGRDTELGREVAVKLLLGAIEPERLQRFLDEAQIAGQLQHPGVVPVHELGLAADGRPYFAMKLVKGRTLAVLLESRSDPGQEGRRFLSIFEQVCQTMAYAHARGVAHRDLKPTNIMVGAFGEVLVLDWGLAKVLSHGGVADERRTPSVAESAAVRTVRSSTPGTASQEGSVLGTPAYMAPEQARGEVDQIDERADVFALGALLCEILTGRPPYLGDTWVERWRQAQQGALREAFEALDGCGADRELIDLARHCLARKRSQRPRDAGVVAKRVGEHLAAVEERAQQARLQAVAAEAKAHEERRVRRFAVALASSIVLAVSLCSGGYLWYAHERGLRAAETARQVGAAMQEASVRRGRAASSSPDELGAWTLALAAGEQAVKLARMGGATADVLSGAERLLADMQSEEQQAEADRRMVERLDEIHAVGMELAFSYVDAAYTRAFLGYGIDVDGQDSTTAVEHVRASAIHTELSVALDSWIDVRMRREPQSDWERLDTIVRAADPDAWRTELRDAMRTEDLDLLRELAGAPGLADLPARSLLLLGRALKVSGDRDSAVTVLNTALRGHPDDYRLHLDLGSYLGEVAPRRVEESLQFVRAAVALRPRHVGGWITRGHILEWTDPDEALLAYQQVLEIRPDSHAHMHIGCLLNRQGKHEAAIESFRKSIALGPHNTCVYTFLGDALKEKGDLQAANAAFNDAIAAHTKEIGSDPRDYAAQYHLALARQSLGDLDGAIVALNAAIDIQPRYQDLYNVLGRILRDKDKKDLDPAIAAFRTAISIEPRYYDAHFNLGFALYSKRDFAGAIDAYNKAIAIGPGKSRVHFNLGLAHWHKGELDEAIAAYNAELVIDPRDPKTHYNLGIALDEICDFDKAILAYQEAVRLEDDYAEAHCNLGRSLTWKGRFDEARACIRRGHELGLRRADWNYPSARWLEESELYVSLARRLPAILTGEDVLTVPEEHAAVAHVCYCTRLYAAAAKFWDSMCQSKLTGTAAALDCDQLYDAACAAALAASGQGEDAGPLDEAARVRWRCQASAWLQAALAGRRESLASGATSPAQTVSMLQHWKRDRDLSALREADALAALPESEREPLRALWAEVDALLASISNQVEPAHGAPK